MREIDSRCEVSVGVCVEALILYILTCFLYYV